MNSPTRRAKSPFEYQSDKWKAIAWPNIDSPTPTNNRHTNRPAGLNVAAWQVAATDQINAPDAIDQDGLICFASRVPGICAVSEI